jgi:hypothetical protein
MIDTGDVLASGSVSPMQNAVTVETATELAGKAACEKLKPSFDAAFARRVEHGTRVTVTVPVVAGAGVNLAEAALATLRAQTTLVASATLKAVDDKAAVIDVVARAGDGVGLALALARVAGADHVTAVGPATFTFVP